MGQTNPDEHMLLDDNKYIADVLYEVKNSKQKDLQQSRLLFKKRMFRETDETITEAQFVNLSYVQVACLLTGMPVGCFSVLFLEHGFEINGLADDSLLPQCFWTPVLNANTCPCCGLCLLTAFYTAAAHGSICCSQSSGRADAPHCCHTFLQTQSLFRTLWPPCAVRVHCMML